MMHTMSVTSADQPPPTFDAAIVRWLHQALAEQGRVLDPDRDAQALAVEASQRTFYRIYTKTTQTTQTTQTTKETEAHQSRAQDSLILMQSPPDLENNLAFVDMAAAMRSVGVNVPTVYRHAVREGLLLLSDLGSDHLADAYRDGRMTNALATALVTLERIQQLPRNRVPPYSTQRFSDELDIFIDWLVKQACNLALPDALFEPVRQRLLSNTTDQDQVCVHRDYHCRNLLMPLEGDAASGVGVVDFQDALFGPAAYDVASLLYDCYWSFDELTIAHYADSYRVNGKLVGTRQIELTAVQRQLKAIGIFARLALRDQKLSHLPYINPVIHSLVRLCAKHSETQALADWLAERLQPAASAWLTALQAGEVRSHT